MGCKVIWAMGLVVGLLHQPAAAHDIYTPLQSPAGQFCCGGDPIRGDCEAIRNPLHNADGSATFYSERYRAPVRVAHGIIQWLPVAGGEEWQAHWCGVARNRVAGGGAPPGGDQIDPVYWTYCAFWDPGGV
jgi:hypothetical protein